MSDHAELIEQLSTLAPCLDARGFSAEAEAMRLALSALRAVEGRNEALSRSLDQAREGLENPCLQMRRPDEPFFVLLGRDAQAISAVWHWIAKREEVEGYSEKTKAARKVALAMEAYLSSLEGNQKQTKTGRLPPAEGRAGSPSGRSPSVSAQACSSLTQIAELVNGQIRTWGDDEWITLHVRSGGAETTTSLTHADAAALAGTLLHLVGEDSNPLEGLIAECERRRRALASCDGNAKRQDPKGETA